MYETTDVLRIIDHSPWVWAFTVIGWICGTVQFLEGIRLTHRDRVIALPLGYLIAIFAHDSYVAFNYDHWFHTVNHWYFTTFWYFYPFWVCVEFLCICWFARLAYREFAPPVSTLTYYSVIAAYLAAATAAFNVLSALVDDPLHIVGLAISQIVNVVFMIPLLLRRGSAAGSSRVLAWAIFIGPRSLGLLMSPAMCPPLRTPLFYALVACMALLSGGYVVLLEQLRDRGASDRSVLSKPV
jgi:hypothetical protein